MLFCGARVVSDILFLALSRHIHTHTKSVGKGRLLCAQSAHCVESASASCLRALCARRSDCCILLHNKGKTHCSGRTDGQGLFLNVIRPLKDPRAFVRADVRAHNIWLIEDSTSSSKKNFQRRGPNFVFTILELEVFKFWNLRNTKIMQNQKSYYTGIFTLLSLIWILVFINFKTSHLLSNHSF